MKNLTLSLLLSCAIPSMAQEAIDFNRDWQIRYPATSILHSNKTESVTLPRAWNEEFAYRVPIEALPDDTVRYTKTFLAPKAWKGKKVFIEFEGARQSAEVWLNGTRIGLHQNGVMAFGFDLTTYIKIGKENKLEVLTDNDWSYHEKNADGTEIKVKDGVVVKDGNNLPNNELKPTSFQWNNKNFNANYGGLPKNVRLHVVPKLYQTLPLYSTLGTTGTYVYAKDIDTQAHSATIHAESEVKNETGKALKATYKVEVIDRQTQQTVASFSSDTYNINKGETVTMSAEKTVNDLHFWSWGYGYLYDVVTSIECSNHAFESTRTTTTGFRKTDFHNGITYLNDRAIMVHGYAQRTSNEWPGVGMSVTPWLSDYSNRLVVESGGNLVRWMHVCPWKQDIESCDRVGLMQAMPAGDAEKDVTGRHWEQRTELMRDAIIYNCNNPSIIFYECGNKGISEDHMTEMKAIRDLYDPHGGRAIGSREMLNHDTSAEYGGEMLYINKSATKPVWAMEYCRDEALRRYWDDWSPVGENGVAHKQGDGPLYRNADASAYNQNNDQFAIEMVRRWYDYWQVRPGTGDRVSDGGVKIVFSDTNTHNRGESNYRTSGVVDAMRLPKDAFYAHQVMWNGWITPEASQTYIIGHWNYEHQVKANSNAPFCKPVFVVSDAPAVKLFLNGKEVGKEKIDYHFLHTFDSIPYAPGTLTAISYNEQGKEISKHEIRTVGKAARIVAEFHSPAKDKLNADGADMGFIDFKIVDADGSTCPLANNMVHFSVEGPVEWIGGIANRDSVKYREEWERNPNCIRSLDLPVECGVNRALVRSKAETGKAIIRYVAEGLEGASAKGQIEIDVENLTQSPTPFSELAVRGETPTSPSYKDLKRTLHPSKVTAGSNQNIANNSIDDSEDTEWKNDGKASTAWIRYDFDSPVRVDELSMKLTGWRQRSYPIEILADTTIVWQGGTPQSLGYVHINIANPVVAKSITIRLKGTATSNEAFGQITELVEPVANELDLYKAKDGDKVRSELRIVECDFLQFVDK